jgi:hypothetical protein
LESWLLSFDSEFSSFFLLLIATIPAIEATEAAVFSPFWYYPTAGDFIELFSTKGEFAVKNYVPVLAVELPKFSGILFTT